MSVLIKGMEMPKTCIMCWFSPICPVWVKEVSRYKGYDNRLPNCPLIEVPTPHGRLIDIETLKDDMAVLLERNGKLIYEWLAYRVEDTIDDQATIIEAEEERG